MISDRAELSLQFIIKSDLLCKRIIVALTISQIQENRSGGTVLMKNVYFYSKFKNVDITMLGSVAK
jgi:hypothetical protein